MATPAPTLGDDTCAVLGCTDTYVNSPKRKCQCFYGCHRWENCCSGILSHLHHLALQPHCIHCAKQHLDFSPHCDGMGALEAQEKIALQDVAAFSVFWSIILFVIALILLCWAAFFLYSHCKKHRGHSSFQQSGFILSDNKPILILSYTSMSLYTLSLFCYLVANGTLGVDYDNTKVFARFHISFVVIFRHEYIW